MMDIILLILGNALTFCHGFNDAILFEGKKWESFHWDEHWFLIIFRGLQLISILTASLLNPGNVLNCTVAWVFMFMMIHNGSYYQTRKWIDIEKFKEIEYPKGFFDMTRTPYKLFGVTLSFPFYIRLILFTIGLILFIWLR